MDNLFYLILGEKERVNKEECNKETVQYGCLLAAEKDLSSIDQVRWQTFFHIIWPKIRKFFSVFLANTFI